MANKYSDSLSKFRELIKKDYKKISQKSKKEENDLLSINVANCPAQAGPELAKKFTDYGLKSGYHYSIFKKKIIDSLKLKKDETYRYCEKGEDMETLIDEIVKIYSSRSKPIIFFSKGNYSEMDSLYIRLRNSFAHGNYFKKGNYYFLWNETGSANAKKKLGAFMCLKYEHLKDIYEALERWND